MPSAASKRLLRDLPTDDEMIEIMANLRLTDDVATAVLGTAYLENTLERILKAKFVDLTKDDERRMFDGAANGILGSFSNKIRLAYAINILGPICYHDLMLINDIRNVFAHSLHRVTFAHPLVIEDCTKLQFRQHFHQTTTRVTIELLNPDPVDIFAETIMYLYICMLNFIMQIHNDRLPKHWLDDTVT